MWYNNMADVAFVKPERWLALQQAVLLRVDHDMATRLIGSFISLDVQLDNGARQMAELPIAVGQCAKHWVCVRQPNACSLVASYGTPAYYAL